MIEYRPINGYSFIDNFFHEFYEKLNDFKTFLPGNIDLIEKRYKRQVNDIKKEKNKFNKEYEKIYKKSIDAGFPKEEAHEIAEQEYGGYSFFDIKQTYLDFYIETKKFSIDTTLKSYILLLYSLIESSLVDLINIIINEKLLKLKLDDINGSNYLNQSIIYFEKVLDYSLDNKTLDKIKKYQKIRNSIVHENSYIKNKTISQIINHYKSFINVKDDNIFHFIDKGIVDTFISLIKEFFKALEIELERKYNFPSLKKKYDQYLFTNFMEQLSDPIIKIEDKIINYSTKAKYKGNEFNIELTYTKQKANSTLYLEVKEKEMYDNEFLIKIEEKQHKLVESLACLTNWHKNYTMKFNIKLY